MFSSINQLKKDFKMSNEKELSAFPKKEQEIFRTLISRAKKEKGYDVLITDGVRTYAEEVALHKKNPKNAKPGTSKHGKKKAIDINLMKNGVITHKKATSKSEWEKTGVPSIAREMGLEWGGDFKNYHDPVHFAIPSTFTEKATEIVNNAVDVVNKNQGITGIIVAVVIVMIIIATNY